MTVRSKQRSQPFSKLQLIHLLGIVYLGSWMANAFRTDNELLDEYEQIEQTVFSLAQSTGLADQVYRHDTCGKLHLTPDFLGKQNIECIRNEYDEDVFWDELIQRLARRDLEEALGTTYVKNMNDSEYRTEVQPYIERWAAEINRFGLERITTPSLQAKKVSREIKRH